MFLKHNMPDVVLLFIESNMPAHDIPAGIYFHVIICKFNIYGVPGVFTWHNMRVTSAALESLEYHANQGLNYRLNATTFQNTK